jgi:hypothetical protein
MKVILTLLLLTLTGISHAGSGSYHVCTNAKGQKLFTQDPCPDGQAAEVKNYSVSEGLPPADQRISTDNPVYVQMRDSNRRAELERTIKKNEKGLSKLEQQMNTELAELKRKSGYANNNLAGATYRQGLATEMQAVTDRYKVQIQTRQDELNRQRDELAGLGQ